MNQQMDIRKLEQKTYLSYQQDGFWDIFLGLFMLGFAFSVFFDSSYFLLLWVIVMIPSAAGFKKVFVEKRLGYVKFSAERAARIARARNKMRVLMFIAVLLGFLVWYAFTGNAGWQLWIRKLEFLPFGIVIGILIGAAGLVFDIKRISLYGLLTIILFLAGYFMHTNLGLIFTVLGAICLITGIVLLVRFMKKYPKIERSVSDEPTD
ncbi:MAG: hypothetical protein AB1746_00450 [Candidatus Zixiibacteriota bacterium]